MILSHRYKYIFVEAPLTASTAISRELCEYYSGEKILRKHATYNDFLRNATNSEKNYFLAIGVRNPLDQAVSFYQKLKTNHRNSYTSPEQFEKNRGWVGNKELKMFNFIRNTNAEFSDFFLKYLGPPKIRLNHFMWSPRNYDHVIRFETIQTDFSIFLDAVGAEQVRPLPVINKTAEKADFLSYFPREMHKAARYVFGPYMKDWGYEFPESWGDAATPKQSAILYSATNALGRFLCVHLNLTPDDVIRTRRRIAAWRARKATSD